MSVIGSNILAGAAGQGGGYVIDNSLRLRKSASAYLNRTPATAGNRKTWTWSGWVKVGSTGFNNLLECVGPTTPSTRTSFMIQDLNNLEFFTDNASSSRLRTTQLFRDYSAWYHIVIAVDTTQATASNRVKIYVNGAQITSFSIAVYPSLNLDTQFNNTQLHTIGRVYDPFYADMYLTEVNFIDGQALTPSSFGDYNEDTGVWQPAKYAGSYGTNGFYLNFSDATTTTTLAEDSSGNGNDWTPNNISLTAGVTYDSMTDTPTPYADGGNYAVLNPLDNPRAYVTYSNANLTAINTTNASHSQFEATQRIGTTLPKIYWEVTTNGDSNTRNASGIGENIVSTSTYAGAGSRQFGWYVGGASSVFWRNEGSNLFSVSWVAGDVLCFAYEPSTGKFYGGKNGTFYSSAGASTGDPATDTNPTVTISSPLEMLVIGSVFNQGVGSYLHHNFGQRPFAYTPPTGFKSLHTGNLPDSAIENGSEYFAATTYTGNNGTQSVSNGSFQPDLVWVKNRTNAFTHLLYDSVRGVGTLKAISSSETTAEGSMSDNATFGYLDSINSAGFTVISGSSANSYTNSSSNAYIGWQWKAGGAAVTNTAGSITSQVSASPTAGFCVVTYTGTGANATVGHGLGAAPSMVIVKNRGAATQWAVYHQALGNTNTIYLNLTNAIASQPAFWNSTTPTASVISLGTDTTVNASGQNLVAYCFSEVPGYSSFGSYVGNGSTDGPFVYLGFRPAFVMFKSTGANVWSILDSSRDLSNVTDLSLQPSSSIAEETGKNIDFLSNGFKLRQTDGGWNGSGTTYIYMAFAENPFKNSLAR